MRSSPWKRSAFAVQVVSRRGGIPGALRCLAYRRASPGAIMTAAIFSLTGFDVVRSTSVLNHRRRLLLLYDHVTRGCSPLCYFRMAFHKPALPIAGWLDNRTLSPPTAYRSALTYMAITDGHSIVKDICWEALCGGRSAVSSCSNCVRTRTSSVALSPAARAPSGRAIHCVALPGLEVGRSHSVPVKLTSAAIMT